MKSSDAVMNELHKAKDSNAQQFKTLGAYVAHLKKQMLARQAAAERRSARARKAAV